MMAKALLTGSTPVVAQAVSNMDDIRSQIVKSVLSLCPRILAYGVLAFCCR